MSKFYFKLGYIKKRSIQNKYKKDFTNIKIFEHFQQSDRIVNSQEYQDYIVYENFFIIKKLEFFVI